MSEAPLVHSDLVALARSNDISSLESAWTEAAAQPGDVEAYCAVLETLCEQDLPGKALTLGSEMVQALLAQERGPEARRIATLLVERKVHNEKVAQQLFELIEAQDGGESWYSVICGYAGLSGTNVSAQGLADYEKFRHFTVGHVLFHRAGWGEGKVTDFDSGTNELVIDFVNGRAREMPLQAAIESLQPLPTDDLRSMRILDPEQLETLAQEDPSVLIRKAAKIFRGKITSTKVKETLCPSVVPTKKWATFWKKAKAAAAHDPWLQVEGSSTRPVFVLRKRPVSLAEEAAREIQYADDLADSISICRNYLARCHDDHAVGTILDLAQNVVEEALKRAVAEADTDRPDPAHLLDGILLLAEHNRTTSVTPAEELRVLLNRDGTFQPETLNELKTPESRGHAVSLLPEALGEGWAETCVELLPRFPADVVEAVIQKIVDVKKAHLTLKLWEVVAPYPRQHPMLTYMMGCLYADGHFDGLEGAPDKFTVGRVLMHLVRTLNADRKGDTQKGTPPDPTRQPLDRPARNSSSAFWRTSARRTWASYYGITERGGQDFPQEIGTDDPARRRTEVPRTHRKARPTVLGVRVQLRDQRGTRSSPRGVSGTGRREDPRELEGHRRGGVARRHQ